MRLRERGHRVLAMDLRGHGGSVRHPRDTSANAHADDVAGLLGRLGAGPAVLVGQSLGGRVALRVAVEHPSLVRGLALVEADARPASGAPGDAAIRWLRSWPLPFPDRASAAAWLGGERSGTRGRAGSKSATAASGRASTWTCSPGSSTPFSARPPGPPGPRRDCPSCCSSPSTASSPRRRCGPCSPHGPTPGPSGCRAPGTTCTSNGRTPWPGSSTRSSRPASEVPGPGLPGHSLAPPVPGLGGRLSPSMSTFGTALSSQRGSAHA
ncbi:alpha/beta fold hydrolase [Streptomyces sp. SA3_actF]|uniref:alpha/beta fold hydrolase n=1 Tax=Streptomyces sp. SA3_actF TaxID=682181 RepID=UPI001F41F181|nr:alpha/beta fold hydrolase [Streptomyces sp. SA3_actF]